MTEPFISINELSKRINVPAHTLRYWEKTFDGAIRPVTGAGGRRYYRDEDAAKIESIKGLLYDQGYTIAGVRKLLEGGNLPDSKGKARAAGKKKPDPESIESALSLLAKAKAALG
ncbi:MAG: MerR family transcriptional regulator [Alphaproteobacteria bacterium]|nr:MerR family transcriptional regulator [Alphaproteobacteria bacterium]